jgi:hypothetical protein
MAAYAVYVHIYEYITEKYYGQGPETRTRNLRNPNAARYRLRQSLLLLNSYNG